MNLQKLITVEGTTASGKSGLGIELARSLGGEVISADSRQIYRGLDLGTGKVTPEETRGVPHHLLDIIDPNTPFSMAEYQQLAYEAIDGVISRGSMPFLVGGTGLYTRAVVRGFCLVDAPPDPELRAAAETMTRGELVAMLSGYGVTVTDPQVSPRRLIRMIEKIRCGYSAENESKPRYLTLRLGMNYPRDVLCDRIEERLDARLEAGMVREIEELLRRGATPDFLMGLGLEYRYTYMYVAGMYPTFDHYRSELLTEIKRFAKRQMTWFRRDEDIIWLDTSGDYTDQALTLCHDFLGK